jgi:hypothetical protein
MACSTGCISKKGAQEILRALIFKNALCLSDSRPCRDSGHDHGVRNPGGRRAHSDQHRRGWSWRQPRRRPRHLPQLQGRVTSRSADDRAASGADCRAAQSPATGVCAATGKNQGCASQKSNRCHFHVEFSMFLARVNMEGAQ